MNEISKIKGVLKSNYSLKHLTWFKVGGNADLFFKPKDVEDLTLFLRENDGKLPITIIGAGSNIIIRDSGVEGVVIKLGQGFTNIEIVPVSKIIKNNSYKKIPELLSVQAGCLNFNLAKFCQQNKISGFEFLVGIPGTVGGGIAMNAGAYGREFKDIVHSVEALDESGNFICLTLEELGFGYRSNSLTKNLIFTNVFFNIIKFSSSEIIKQEMNEIIERRKTTQPITEKTSGSTFANPANYRAWELIDTAGMRNAKIGDACMSNMHCNFMINLGNATAQDMEELGELVIKKVKEICRVDLKWEIKRIGRRVL